MRFLDLALIRWGGFTDRKLAFRPDAKLHLVYGPNEAGKTTLLRGVRDLLFGIEPRTPFDFVHAMNALSLGGTIEGRDGQRLAFLRRKGNKNTLLDTAQRPLPDGALAPFLGGVDKRMFEDMFGLSHEAMRAGGQAMVQAQGELGSSLFAASSGLRGLLQVRKRLGEEADALFTPHRRASRAFYAALDRLAAAQQQVRTANLSPEDWRRLERDRADAEKEREALNTELRATRRRRDQLDVLRRAAPLLRDIERLNAELANLAEASPLPDDFEERLATIRSELAASQAALAQEGEALERVLAERAAVDVDAALLAAAAAIEGAYSRIGALPGYRADVVKLERDLRLIEEEIAGQLAAMRESAGAAGPGDADAAVLRDLAGRRQALEARREEAAERLAAAEEAEARLRGQAEGRPAIPRPVAEQATLDQLLQHGDVDAAARAAERAAEDARRAVAEAQQRLGLGALAVHQAVALPVPAVAAVEAFARRFGELADRRRDLTRDCDQARRQARAVRDQLGDLAAAGDLPTPDRVAAARSERDRGWRLVRRLFVEADPGAAAEAEAYGGAGRLPDAYEEAVRTADGVADRRDAEAERVTRHAHLTLEAGRCDAAVAQAEAALAEVREAEAGERARWSALWEPSGVVPSEPDQMLEWLRRHDELLRLRERLGAAEAEAAAAAARRAEVREGALRLLAALGAAGDDTLTSRDLLARAGAAIKAREAAAGEAERIADDLRKAGQAVAAERRHGAKLEAELKRWQQDWREALARAALPPDLAPGAIEVILKAWGDIRARRARQAETRRRLTGLKSDIAAFEKEAEELTARLAPDLSLPADKAVEALHEKLKAARSAETRARVLDGRIAELRHKRQEAANAIGRHEAALASLQAMAGAADQADLPERVRIARRRAETERALQQRRRDLETAVPGADPAALAAALAAEALDGEGLAAEIDRLGDRMESLSDDLAAVAARLQDIAARMEAIRGGVDAAGAAQDVRHAVAELRTVTLDWMRTRTAELLLARSIERFRAAAQDPLVRRAGDIFRRVTLGAYAGLAVDFDGDDQPVLMGVDRDGGRCPVDRMSDGTSDQLYLALRIAAVERYAQQAEPMPFIADDLFINWDDSRTAEGIAALAELGETTQVILLSHHLAVVEAAAERLPPEALQVIHLAEAPAAVAVAVS